MGTGVLRITGAYMPHGGRDDMEVEAAYAQLEDVVETANQEKKLKIIAGDFNAELGRFLDKNDIAPMQQNSRGARLQTWSSLNGFDIVNKCVADDLQQYWTYRNGSLRKQLDYFLTDSVLTRFVSFCAVNTDLDTGSDHRALELRLQPWGGNTRRIHKMKKAPQWNTAVDVQVYRESLRSSLAADDRNPAAQTSVKACALEKHMLDACAAAQACAHVRGGSDKLKEIELRIREAIEERNACSTEDPQRRATICKKIKRLIRTKLVQKKEEKIERILVDFRGLREISEMSQPGRRQGIACIQDSSGVEHCDQDGIVEAFAAFYEHLYACHAGSTLREGASQSGNERLGADNFSMEELTCALRKLKNGKTKDGAGIAAEMLKQGGDDLHIAILDLFNDVLAPGASPPDTWKRSRLKVIFKKGDGKLPKNYRPIAILPILYKLFSRMLCRRVQDAIFKDLSPDQAAYRPSFSTEDHLLSFTLLFERCREWCQDLWLGLVDFEKAFDTVEHSSLWPVLADLGVEPCYVEILQRLYACQDAVVDVVVQSRPFKLERGAKQGDPISGLLFLAVMEACFRPLRSKWCALNARRAGQYFGIVVDDPLDPLTNLRFADDVLLIAQSPADVRKMIEHLRCEAAKYGLKINMDKTKVLTNTDLQRPRPIHVSGEVVELIGREGSERYLGRKLCLGEYHQTELDNRLRGAWAAFTKFKCVFKSRAYTFRLKAKLFESTVSPVLLYSSASWTLTQDMESKILTTQRRMLRTMLGKKRLPTEDWVTYVKRTTEEAESMMRSCGYHNWIEQSPRKKLRFAVKTASVDDNRWSKRLLDWKPFFRCSPRRRAGHPYRRWEDPIIEIAGGDWPAAAADMCFWHLLETGYMKREEV